MKSYRLMVELILFWMNKLKKGLLIVVITDCFYKFAREPKISYKQL